MSGTPVKILFTSTAHEIVQCIPLFIECYKCRRCNKVRYLQEMFIEKCTPHYEDSTSGWVHDNNYPKVFIYRDRIEYV